MTRHEGFGKPSIRCRYFEEPELIFADGYRHIDPKWGISESAPKSFSPSQRHPSMVRIGFIGTAETIQKARDWMERGAKGYPGDDKHPTFPGFQNDRGFRSQLIFDENWVAQLMQSEISDILEIRESRRRFETLLDLLEERLKLLSEKDFTPEYVVVALPDDLYRRCRTIDYNDGLRGRVHRDLRRAFKAIAMKYRMPTQLLRQITFEDNTGDIISKIYWNYFTGLYFKAGGFPWGPVGLEAGTCYIGISFFRPLGSALSKMQTSLAQAFDEHGDGLVLRGYEFEWNPNQEGTNSPHLSEEQAFNLTELILQRYRAHMGQNPLRVVVHKTSRYWPAERRGFSDALKKHVTRFDLMALARQNRVRLLTTNKYPPLRGTHFAVDDIDFLYTTGFIAQLGEFHGLHVPSPIQIADHVGQDTSREALLREILILTKMNWNSARLGGLMPITIRFSRLVGDIMKEIPPDQEPGTNFKFYM